MSNLKDNGLKTFNKWRNKHTVCSEWFRYVQWQNMCWSCMFYLKYTQIHGGMFILHGLNNICYIQEHMPRVPPTYPLFSILQHFQSGRTILPYVKAMKTTEMPFTTDNFVAPYPTSRTWNLKAKLLLFARYYMPVACFVQFSRHARNWCS